MAPSTISYIGSHSDDLNNGDIVVQRVFPAGSDMETSWGESITSFLPASALGQNSTAAPVYRVRGHTPAGGSWSDRNGERTTANTGLTIRNTNSNTSGTSGATEQFPAGFRFSTTPSASYIPRLGRMSSNEGTTTTSSRGNTPRNGDDLIALTALFPPATSNTHSSSSHSSNPSTRALSSHSTVTTHGSSTSDREDTAMLIDANESGSAPHAPPRLGGINSNSNSGIGGSTAAGDPIFRSSRSNRIRLSMRPSTTTLNYTSGVDSNSSTGPGAAASAAGGGVGPAPRAQTLQRAQLIHAMMQQAARSAGGNLVGRTSNGNTPPPGRIPHPAGRGSGSSANGTNGGGAGATAGGNGEGGTRGGERDDLPALHFGRRTTRLGATYLTGIPSGESGSTHHASIRDLFSAMTSTISGLEGGSGRLSLGLFDNSDGANGNGGGGASARRNGPTGPGTTNPSVHPQFRSKAVHKLFCKHCDGMMCNRGMKAILLGNTKVELFSTDTPPTGVQLVWADYLTQNCSCRIRDAACLGCGNVVGYHVTSPCDTCLEACNNGHFWMFLSDGVNPVERLDFGGQKALRWAALPAADDDCDTEKKPDTYETMCR